MQSEGQPEGPGGAMVEIGHGSEVTIMLEKVFWLWCDGWKGAVALGMDGEEVTDGRIT